MLKKLLKNKAIQIALISVIVVAVLTAAFFWAPGASQPPAVPMSEYSESNTSDYSTPPSRLATEPSSSPQISSGVSTTGVIISSAATTSAINTTASAKPKSTAATQKNTATATKEQAKTSSISTKPENVTTGQRKQYNCTLSIRCDTILNNLDKFNKNKMSVLPKDGVIISNKTVTFYDGESVFDVLKRETKNAKIHLDFNLTPAQANAYILGINNIYEFDCGPLSGWRYRVNGQFPNLSSSSYILKPGDVIEWLYTCDLGRDIE